ncbi:zinc-binding protein A33-like [Impatiens glandulifera]|uniref:zinc-binding protein A33-like n=1 Tax=Impatiens glandulifera TaxID=253017 RepID=UPI001FB12321|nr:zinc-binding protein A33-like [Impatiens glandulifera]
MEMKEGETRRNGLAGLSLSTILGEGEKPLSPGNRTLLDIISDDPNSGFKKNKKNWTAFKDMIRLQRAGVAWTSIITIPVSDVNVPNLIRSVSSGAQSFRRPPTLNISDPIHEPIDQITTGENSNQIESDSALIPINRPQMVRRDSSRVPAPASKRYSSLNIAGDEFPEVSSEGSEEGEEEEKGTHEESTSLMALLDFNEDDDEDDDDEEDGDGDSDESVEYSICSVCMVSHKGAAFVPCGHAFCRLCSRELWVQRGTTCPLCNGFVVEILDIF